MINTAASEYVRENVYNYDITFRHLMAFNPSRSWAVTYNQMWNLSMKEPIPKNFGQKSGFNHYPNSFQGKSTSRSGNGNSSGSRRKSDYCWNINKGVPCKFGARCKFIERCRYCDSSAHGKHVCPKLAKRNDGGNSSQTIPRQPVQESKN